MITASPVRRVYYSEQTGYSVVVYKTNDPIPLQAVSEYCGTMPCFKAAGRQLPDTEGLLAELDGEWKENRYGWQMQVSTFRTFLPKTREGIVGYLSSGLVKGLGPVTAERIVERFGEDTFRVMEQEPDRLLDIRGITPAKLEEIRSTFLESSRVRELMAYLAPYGVSANRVRKIQETFGEKAVDILKENPYRLTEVAGMGFLTVDPVARKMEGLQADSIVRLQAVLEHVLKQAALSGHLYLQAGEAVQQAGILLGRLQTPVEEKKIRDAGNRMVKEGRLKAFDGGIYLKKNYRDEAVAAKETVRLLEADIPQADVREVLEKAQKLDGICLGEKQKEAVLNTFKSPVSIITGGPGRGKTTVLRTILRIFKMTCPQEDVLLTAPTGRAARRMAESTGYAAMTLHRALGLTDEGEEPEDTGMIGESLVIVDEMTMVDMFLAARLLERIPEGSRVVLVGDVDQLPSVGPGNVFRELIACKKIPVTVLDVSYRQKDNQLLLENAELINTGKTRLKFGKEFRFIRTDSPEQTADCIVGLYRELAEKAGLEDVQVLSPVKKQAVVGTQDINRLLQEAVNPGNGGVEMSCGDVVFRKGDKVMQIKNTESVSNGDIGRVEDVWLGEDGKTELSVTYSEDRSQVYREEDMEMLVHAFAITVHKSQGCEYPVVIMPVLPAFYRMLKRNILYTAVTRASAAVYLVGSTASVVQAIHRSDVERRNTKLALRIRQEMKDRQNVA
ncbi:MAG: ATP-dependent RecD-like DNA helicase [Eisenbergiella sp.]